MSQEEAIQERGLHNPNIVDLITKDPETDEVVMVLLQRRPWPSDRGLANLQLQDKLNGYFDYVVGEHLTKEYPQYQEHKVRIQLEWIDPIPETLASTLQEAEKIARKFRMGFVCTQMDADKRLAPWESPE